MSESNFRRGRERFEAAFAHRNIFPIPRGELWVAGEILADLGLTDDLKGRIRLCNVLGMDFVGLPVSWRESAIRSSNYRHFTLKDVVEATRMSDLPVAAIIDGPLSRLAARMSLQELLQRVGENVEDLKNELEKAEMDGIPLGELVMECAESGNGLIVLADDLAYELGTFLRPAHLGLFLFPIYSRLVSHIHRRSVYAIIHSDGNLTSILPDIVACGFDGIVCQSDCKTMNVALLKEQYGHGVTWFTGIDGTLLSESALDETSLSRFKAWIGNMKKDGGLVLSSCVGLCSSGSVRSLQTLYAYADIA